MPTKTLEELPTELQIHIIKKLDCFTLAKFRATNHHFRNLTIDDIIQNGFLKYELSMAAGVEDGRAMMSKWVCLCYGCLKVMHMQKFAVMRDDHCEMFGLGDNLGYERRCTKSEKRSGHMRQVMKDYCSGSYYSGDE